jgi:hypothetical protein
MRVAGARAQEETRGQFEWCRNIHDETRGAGKEIATFRRKSVAIAI